MRRQVRWRAARSYMAQCLLLAAGVAALACPAGAQEPSLQAPAMIQAGAIEVHHWPHQETLARRVADFVTTVQLPALPADILAGPPIRLVLAPDAEAFAELTGGRVPDWGAGVAMPSLGLIVIPTHRAAAPGVQALLRIVTHELAHIGLYRYLEPARIPRWFNEGYAVWAAGQFDLEAGWLLRVAFLTNRAPPLDSLVLDWPVGAADARVAYLLSASAVRYLHRNGGDFAMTRFLERWAEGLTMEEALFQTYGLTLTQLERHWSRDVRRNYGWLLFFAQATVVWTGIGILVLVLFLIRRRRNRGRLALLREGDQPDAPAYWLDPPESVVLSHDNELLLPPSEEVAPRPPDGADPTAAEGRDATSDGRPETPPGDEATRGG
jgi:hypothetical protein